MARISPLLAERFARQGLAAGAGAASVAQAARMHVAVQAQDPAAARLGLRVRAAGVTEATVRVAVVEQRSVVRSWLMRSTVHLVDSADLRWMTRLLGDSIVRRHEARWRALGLTPEVRERCLAALPAVLADGPLTRREVAAELAARDAPVPDGDAYTPTHVLAYASAKGLVCRAGDRGRDATFALVEDWLPDAPAGPSGDEALAMLARRYFTAFSPATAADFTTWSGLPSARALELIRDELRETEVDGRPGFRLGAVEGARGVRLLPAFDNYLLGYRDRDAILAAEAQPRVYQGGMIRPSVVADGRVVGSWALQRASGRRGSSARVTVRFFEGPTKITRRGVEREVADIGRFLEQDVTVEFEDGA